MTLLRVLYAEALKIRRTIAWKMAVLAPGIVVVLAFFAAWQAPFSTINRFGPGQEWAALTRFCMRLWAILMLPLYIVLQSALLAGLDHVGGQWRSILARPLPRWTFYATKLTFVIGLAVAGSVLLALGIVLDGAILPHLQREVVFASPIPWGMILRNCAEVFGLASAGLAIQNWISLRWQSFSVAMAAGIVLLVLGVSPAPLANRPTARCGSSRLPYRCSSWRATWGISRLGCESVSFAASWSPSPRESISVGEK
jgi:hypothetical protein